MVLKLYVGTKFHKNGQKLWKSRNLIPLRYFKQINLWCHSYSKFILPFDCEKCVKEGERLQGFEY